MLKRLFLMMLLAFGMALPQGGFFSQSANGQAAEHYVKKRFLKNVPGVGKEDTRYKELEENQNQPQNRPQAQPQNRQQPQYQPQPQNPQARKPYVPKAQWHPANLTRHWEKHKAEFPNFKTEKEYGDYALNFFQYPPQGTLFKRNQNGDYLFYYQKFNIFGVTTKDGVPKTLFRPSAGINYWNRQ